MNKQEILFAGYMAGYMEKEAKPKSSVEKKMDRDAKWATEKIKTATETKYPQPNIKGKSLPKPRKIYQGPPSKPSTPAEGNDASNDANDLLDPDLRKKVNNNFKKIAQEIQLPGQGMGMMQAATNGFPLNAEQAQAQQAAGGPEQQAMLEAEQKRQAQEQEIQQLEQAKEDTAFEAKKTQMAKDIYQNQMKIKKTQEDMAKAQAEQRNEEALSTMINNSSPGE